VTTGDGFVSYLNEGRYYSFWTRVSDNMLHVARARELGNVGIGKLADVS